MPSLGPLAARARRALTASGFRPRSLESGAAYREHLLAGVWGGVSTGIFLLADVILAKTLDAPGWQITLLATLGPAANVTSFYWAGQVRGRPKAGAFFLGGVGGRLPMGLLLLGRSPTLFITVYFVFSVATALLLTAQNAVLQTRYTDDERPVRFGVVSSVSAIFAIGSAQIAGLLLEYREEFYSWIFVACGFAGAASAFHLFRMEAGPGSRRDLRAWVRAGMSGIRRRFRPEPKEAERQSLRASLRVAARIFQENPDFVRFERDFMIYGFAFLSLLPVLPVYIVRDLSMNYTQLSASKGLWALVGQVVLSPILAASLGRLRPLRFTGRVFLLLGLYPLCLLISTRLDWTLQTRIGWVYAAFLIYSVAMAGVNLSWTLGSMAFAGREDASAYHGLHVALTGVRGLLAPSLGYLVATLFGARAVFLISTLLFLTAGLMMLRHDSRHRRLGASSRPY